MIFFFDIFKLVLKNILERKLRVLLTVSGIIIGIFTFTFFIFLSNGLTNAISNQFSYFGVNVLTVQGVSNNGDPANSFSISDKEIAKIKQAIKGYKYIAPGRFYVSPIEFSREKKILRILSYEDEFWDDIDNDLGFELDSGRKLKQSDSYSIVIGYKIANDVFSKNLKVGDSIIISDKKFRIVGVLKDKGDFMVDNIVLMPSKNLREFIVEKDKYSLLRISFYDGVDLEEMKKAIENKLNKKNKEKVVEVSSPTQIMNQLNEIVGVLKLIIVFISSIALVVGGINVMNTMYSNILERVGEISVLKAIGAENSDILRLFLVESAFFGFVGSIIGFFLAFGLAKLISFIVTSVGYSVFVEFSFEFFLIIVGFTTFMTMIFGTYPAIRAANVFPADNLRDE